MGFFPLYLYHDLVRIKVCKFLSKSSVLEVSDSMNLKNVSRDWGVNKWRCVEGWLDCICERRARSADIEVVKKEKRSYNDGARHLKKKEGRELKQKGGRLPWQVDTNPQEEREDG